MVQIHLRQQQQQHQRARITPYQTMRSSRRCSGWRIVVVVWVAVGLSVVLYHERLVQLQQSSPLDHLISNVYKPFYNLNCPQSVSQSVSQSCSSFSLPKLFLINGRPADQRPPKAVQSWKTLPSDMVVQVYNTSIYLDQVQSVTGCRQTTWAVRLFRMYQLVFDEVLKRYPHDNQGFIFLEDDVALSSVDQFRTETCLAQQRGMNFFSFFTTDSQRGKSSCTYEYGTQSFYASRKLLHQLINNVPLHDLCRLPIDMYIASHGPWYASTNHTIIHLGKRYIPPSPPLIRYNNNNSSSFQFVNIQSNSLT